MVSNDHVYMERLMGRNYVADVKPFAQSQRPDENGVVRTYRYPTEGENPTPFYENLRATLPGVRRDLRLHEHLLMCRISVHSEIYPS
jgi:hypothetical protein